MTNSVAPEPGSLPALINQGLNGIGSATTFVLKHGGSVIAPSILGWTGGWIVGVGRGMGLFQGAASGVYHLVVYKPASKWVSKYEGEGATQLHSNTVFWLKVTGAVAGIALPIILTSYYGSSVMESLSSNFAEGGTVRWLLESNPENYGPFSGMLVSIAPALAQHWISFWRTEDQHRSRRY